MIAAAPQPAPAEQEDANRPRSVSAPWARVMLDLGEAVPATALRGMIVAAVDRLAGGTGPVDGRWRAHVDWHGHIDDENTREATATVLYRERPRGGEVWMSGERTAERVAELARVGAVVARGRVLDVEMSVEMGHHPARMSRAEWWRYETVSPIFPSRNARKRRPDGAMHRRDTPEVRGWAASVIGASILDRLAGWGWSPTVPIAPVVQIVDYEAVRVEWAHAGRPKDTDSAIGFHARWVCNADLPTGLALGTRGTAGFGEIRPWR